MQQEPSIDHAYWMNKAMVLADQAQQCGEVPVGALVVKNQQIIGQGWNQAISTNDPTAHAEIKAIRQACQHEKNYRLTDSTLYVTLEPCTMCAGAIIHSRISTIVFACFEPRAGAGGSVFSILDNSALNHRCEVVSGICGEASSNMLKAFFKSKRQKKQ